MIWDDKASQDDVVYSGEMYAIVNKPLKLIINSRDVVHDVGLAHFRLKMDAVPGTPTTMWFTPLYTTEEMKKKTGKPEFEYEISCDQMCGQGHYTMRGIIKVVTADEYMLWKVKQVPAYTQMSSGAAPAKDSAAAKATAAISSGTDPVKIAATN